MLNNQDFSKFLSQPEKVRFDLKQIVAKLKKKSSQSLNSKLSKSEANAINVKEGISYRDCVEERRKQLVSAEQLHLENVASQLDAEQSKIVGDIEHTHLVRGLDFQLLRKNRKESNETSNPAQSSSTRHNSISSGVQVGTLLGSNIKRLILLNKPSQSISSNLKSFKEAFTIFISILIQ